MKDNVARLVTLQQDLEIRERELKARREADLSSQDKIKALQEEVAKARAERDAAAAALQQQQTVVSPPRQQSHTQTRETSPTGSLRPSTPGGAVGVIRSLQRSITLPPVRVGAQDNAFVIAAPPEDGADCPKCTALGTGRRCHPCTAASSTEPRMAQLAATLEGNESTRPPLYIVFLASGGDMEQQARTSLAAGPYHGAASGGPQQR